MSKTEDVMQKLSEGKSTAEIIEDTGCSKGLVSQCRKKLADNPINEDDDDGTVNDEDLTNSYNSFVKKIKVTPDPEPKPKDIKTYEVSCGACDAEWTVTSDEHISSCPYCGVDLA